MSGMKNLANAVANDPSFAKQAGMSAGEAKQLVSANDPKTPAGVPQLRGPGKTAAVTPSPMGQKLARSVQPGLPQSKGF